MPPSPITRTISNRPSTTVPGSNGRDTMVSAVRGRLRKSPIRASQSNVSATSWYSPSSVSHATRTNASRSPTGWWRARSTILMIRSSRSAALSMVRIHPFKEPPPRPIPFPLQRMQSEVQRFRGLLIGQSQKKLQLNDCPLASRYFVQFVEQGINCDCHFQRRALAEHALGKSIHREELHARPTAGVVDEESAHDPCSYSEKMATIPPVDILGARQAEKGLVNERGGL